MKLPRLDRPARHRIGAFLYRAIAFVVIGAAVTWRGVDLRPAAVGVGLLIVAGLHDLVAATLRPKFWFTSLRAGDRELTHGGAE